MKPIWYPILLKSLSEKLIDGIHSVILLSINLVVKNAVSFVMLYTCFPNKVLSLLRKHSIPISYVLRKELFKSYLQGVIESLEQLREELPQVLRFYLLFQPLHLLCGEGKSHRTTSSMYQVSGNLHCLFSRWHFLWLKRLFLLFCSWRGPRGSFRTTQEVFITRTTSCFG